MTSRILILYATYYGHTAAVARRFAAVALHNGAQCELHDVRFLPRNFHAEGYDAIVVAGSVRFGRHRRALERFVGKYLTVLASTRTAFLSVSGASIKPEGAAEADRYISEFSLRTGWLPDRTLPVAGAFAYTRYNALLRYVMRRIAAKQGLSMDTSRDHDYTDWKALEAFAREFVQTLMRMGVRRAG